MREKSKLWFQVDVTGKKFTYELYVDNEIKKYKVNFI